MSTLARVTSSTRGTVALSPGEVERVARYVEASTTKGTRHKRDQQWDDFVDWCADQTKTPLPAEPATVASYLTWLAADRCGHRADGTELTPMRPSSIRKVRSAIKAQHFATCHADPTSHPGVVKALTGIDRTHQGGRVRQARAAVGDDVVEMASLDLDGLTGLRNKAILLLGYGIAARRSEIVGLDVEDIERRRGTADAIIRRSKTDQTGKGSRRPIPPEALHALDAWLAAAEITTGPIFRRVYKGGHTVGAGRLSDQTVRLVVQQLARLAGLHAPGQESYSGHSLRRGAATTARDNGADTTDIMALGNWRSITSMRRYLDERPWAEDPSAKLGLTRLTTDAPTGDVPVS